MNLQEMINAVYRRVDDSPATADVVEWLNSGKNKMAIAVNATFPDLSATASFQTQTFVFDDKFHELPVLYASARYKEQDGVFNEAQNFMFQFDQGLKEFVVKYEILPQYRDDHTTQQFIATSAGQTFTITKQTYDATRGDLKVFVNNIKASEFTIEDNGTVTVPACVIGDHVTMVWEDHVDMVEPPYSFWGRW
jgi:DNA gyrase/topoisomerase IV subunit B